ncbi:MAG: ATP synthase subunit I [Mariprofundaceae bacterium]|nr:ATP synthase subunit I [Mariprofundaceae bacterium]
MNSNEQDQDASEWFEGMFLLVFFQMLSSMVISLVFYFFWNSTDALGVILGSLLVVLNTWLMQRIFRRDDVSQRDIYMSAALRYVLFIVVLLLFVWLGLNLLAVLGGMIVAYVVSYFFSAYVLLKRKRNLAG